MQGKHVAVTQEAVIPDSQGVLPAAVAHRSAVASRTREIVARGSVAILVGIAGLVLAGWAFGIGWLRAPLAALPEMKVATALALVAAGFSLQVATARRGGVLALGAVGCAAALVVLGALTLLQHALGAADRAPAVQTALGLVLGGLALAAVHRRRPHVAGALAAIVLAVGLFSLLCSVYGTPRLATFRGLAPAAPHTALALVSLALGLLAVAEPGRLAERLTGATAGGAMARRLLPLAFVGLPLLGWLRLEGERLGWYSTTEGTTLLVLAALGLVVGGILMSSGVLNRYEAAREAALEAERQLAAVVEASSEAIVSIDRELRITTWNDAARRLLGYERDEILGQPLRRLLPADRVGETQTLAERVMRTGVAATIDTQRRHRDGSLREVAVSVSPVRAGDRIVGACGIYHDIAQRKEASAELERQVARRTAELAESRRETLQRLAYAAEYRDDDTYHHTERVGHLAALLAARLGLPEHEVALVRQAAPLHDVGKLAVPDSILLKCGPLSEDEFDVVRRHTIAGGRILKGSRSDVLQLAERIALYHHERWDGAGYPMGLSGPDIPLAARIVAVADVYDALTHDRPYTEPWSHEDARAELERVSGSHLDPAVVGVFLELDEHELVPSGSRITPGGPDARPPSPLSGALASVAAGR
jgi:putative two-component system response regulator